MLLFNSRLWLGFGGTPREDGLNRLRQFMTLYYSHSMKVLGSRAIMAKVQHEIDTVPLTRGSDLHETVHFVIAQTDGFISVASFIRTSLIN